MECEVPSLQAPGDSRGMGVHDRPATAHVRSKLYDSIVNITLPLKVRVLLNCTVTRYSSRDRTCLETSV